MLIDITVTYNNEMLEIESKIGNFHVIESANVTLTNETGEDREKIGSVGESKEAILLMNKEIDPKISSKFTFRMINPFEINNFNPKIAANIINFYCRKIHLQMSLKFEGLRLLLK